MTNFKKYSLQTAKYHPMPTLYCRSAKQEFMMKKRLQSKDKYMKLEKIKPILN